MYPKNIITYLEINRISRRMHIIHLAQLVIIHFSAYYIFNYANDNTTHFNAMDGLACAQL